MAYTTTDLTNVEGAISSIVKGERMVHFSIGDKSFEYTDTDLKTLRQLKAEILDEVQSADVRPRFFLTQTDKGL